MAGLSETQDWKVFLVLGSFFFCFTFLFWGAGQNERAFSPARSRITLTPAGCEYVARQTWLPEKEVCKNGSCEIDTDFTQFRLSSVGYVFYGDEDSQSLQISEGQVVGTVRLPDIQNKPWTHEQKVSTWCLALAIVFMLSNLIFIIYSVKKLQSRSKDEG